ncbi:glycine--tRNA ligase subunit beta [Paracraurococcus ruber]|uniref:Glycine--tRNA ligase beta subunit n=1 Tax=Paracraurococcus ruber TaxID=77675 RepID=A0ABS1CYS9_9PROT|nr:glycine--tRNA ligase subunit beta [Paracraurococcus ruber]MBK1659684.1 glycine--tRNA ligase subunit beta [Paracraurococcus ruber]TDG29201.1 glycine--tRNA ligase subunit beta [Paracraurococcus ruber]
MPELLIELFSEEIPARMQARAAEDFCGLLQKALAPLMTQAPKPLSGPRRIAALGEMAARAETAGKEERGPRIGAPDAALDGFLRKHGATRDQLVQEGQFWVLHKPGQAIEAAALIAAALPPLLRGFPWPKSMRWGTSGFAWVRPLQRILCVLDGKPVPFALASGEDAAHGLAAADLTEGHRVLAGTGPFAVRSFAEYERGLRERCVIADAAERERIIAEGIARLAAAEGLEVVPDRGLLAEVAGLVEWPVPLLGRIDAAFMDLPPEVMRTTMRVNQRYFSLCEPGGKPAPRFAIVANIVPEDGGGAIIAGNERVLRARLSDARFFWDLDRKQRLEEFLPKLDSVVFHARLGTQGQRVARLERLAGLIAPLVGADVALAQRAAKLAKADLASGMVGEFPELQGVMGRYYALHGGEDARVAEAVGAHYRPLGPGDAVPREPVAVAVALADKLDQLAGFFAADERPTGSGDPYALRRAALGVIRIIRENGLRLGLADLVAEAFFLYPQATGATASPEFGMAVATETMKSGWQPPKDGRHPPMVAAFAAGLLDFLAERLRVQLRAEGARHDIVAAVFGAAPDDDLVRLLARSDALARMLATADGANLLAAYKRAANILRIENRKDGPHDGPVDPARLTAPAERSLAEAVAAATAVVRDALAAENFLGAMEGLAGLRAPVDAFFDQVVVNDPDPELRRNRLRLLHALCAAMDAVADVSKIEG